MADAENVDQLNKEYKSAMALKAEGNAHFKKQEYQKALKSYSEILLEVGMNSTADITMLMGQFESMSQSDESVKKIKSAINALRVAAFNNMAMVHLCRSEYRKAVRNCTKAIECSSRRFNYKALLRRGRAYRHLRESGKARKDLLFVLQSGYKHDVQILNELKLVDIENFESDEMVLDEQEQESAGQRDQDGHVQRGEHSNAYIKFVGMAVSVMVLAVGLAAFYHFSW